MSVVCVAVLRERCETKPMRAFVLDLPDSCTTVTYPSGGDTNMGDVVAFLIGNRDTERSMQGDLQMPVAVRNSKARASFGSARDAIRSWLNARIGTRDMEAWKALQGAPAVRSISVVVSRDLKRRKGGTKLSTARPFYRKRYPESTPAT